jgi:serine/threonine protein kinase
MVLDGDAAFRRLLAAHLDAAGEYEVMEYDPIRLGMPDRDFSGAGCDALLMGHRLSADPLHVDAAEMIRRFRRARRFPPIVFFTPPGEPRLRERAVRAGAATVLDREGFGHGSLVSAVAGLVADPVPEPEPAEALFSDAAEARGVLSAYRRIDTLATGETSIFLAQRCRDDVRVVIKLLPIVDAGPASADDRLAAFMHEYDIGRRLRHKHIVRFHDAAVSDNYAYIEMEYCERGSLRAVLGRPMAVPRAKDLVAQIASALRALHGIGVCHNDIKPGNILQRGDGSIALADFGMATATGAPSRAQIAGTPAYMSPEMGHGARHDQRSDLYSLGIILFEMLNGRAPYTGGDPMRLIFQHANAALPALPPQAGPLAPVVARLLAKSPRDRFASAEELIRCLKTL